MRNFEPRAQVSLELLVVMAGFLFALALFAPVAVRSTKAVMFAMEAEHARQFLSDFGSASRQASFLSDGTAKHFRVNALTEWEFVAGGSSAQITLRSASLGIEKTISTEIPGEVQQYSCTIAGKTELRMEKIAGMLYISSAQVN